MLLLSLLLRILLLLPLLIRIAYTRTTSAKRGIILPQFYYIRLHTLFSSKLYCMLLLSVLLRLLLLPSLFRIAYTHTTSAKRGIILPQFYYIRLHTLRRSKQYFMHLLSLLILPSLIRIAYTHTTSAKGGIILPQCWYIICTPCAGLNNTV